MILNDIEGKFSKLAAVYLPEWSYTKTNPDGGSVLAMLINDMHNESMKRYARILDKHKIEYLSLFDKLFSEQVKSAKSYVQFKAVAGIDEPVNIPSKTRLIAENGDDRILFETAYSITATNSRINTIYATDGDSDRIVCLSESGDDSFMLSGNDKRNLTEHRLLIGFDNIFDSLSPWENSLVIKLKTIEEDGAKAMAQMLADESVEFYSPSDDSTEHIFPPPTAINDTLILSLISYQPKKYTLNGKPQYVIGVRPKKLIPVEISGVSFAMSANGIAPAEVISQGIVQSEPSFKPFGSPLELYAECGIECGSILARRGALVTMSFNLDYEHYEQSLPSIVSDSELRVIMKKTAEQRHVEPMTVRADCVVLEYLSTQGWKQLTKESRFYQLFNGATTGRVDINFICPSDVFPAEYASGCRMRLRLLRADNLYHIPCIQICPVMSQISFSYHYEEDTLTAQQVITDNHFIVEDITPRLNGGVSKNTRLFYNTLYDKPCVYFGFDKAPVGWPLSMYFKLDNAFDMPVEFMWEYYGAGQFNPLQVIDNTGGLLYSGTLLMPVPDGVEPTVLFGKERYWLRMICSSSLDSSPLINGVHLNMVKVENQLTNKVGFYVDNVEKPITVSLGEKNIYCADVYVNEETGWVKWQKRIGQAVRGRFYDIDMANGEVTILLSAYRLKPNEEAIRVEFQSYQGKAANVSPDSIKSMYEPIKYISSVTNPMAAYGGFDGYNEETGTKMISNMLRTRGRAVTSQDYFDIISQVTYGVRRIKCVSGIDRFGNPADDIITVALLLDEFEKGSHIFSSVKDTIRAKLLSTGSLVPLGKQLMLSQPHFVRISARIWLRLGSSESMYDIQKQTKEHISAFIDPLEGGFYGTGWEIGTIPRTKQLLAYLKEKLPHIHVTRVVMTATVWDREIEVDDEIHQSLSNPFAMAVNGEHKVYIEM